MNRLSAPPADRLAEAARDEAVRWWMHGTDNARRPFGMDDLRTCLDWYFRELEVVPRKVGGYWTIERPHALDIPCEPTDRGAVAPGWAFICLGLSGLAFAAGCLVGH